MTNDLISRSAQHKHLLGPCIASYPSSFTMGLLAAAKELDAAPAVDAVEVVRCRDCVHDGLPTCFTCYIEQHEMIFLNHDPEFFCGAGERRSDGT